MSLAAPLRHARQRLAVRLFGDVIRRMALAELKVFDTPAERWAELGAGPLDRRWHDHATAYDQALQAWRDNPLARRVVGLITDYVIGDGVRVYVRNQPRFQDFLDQVWNHPRNLVPSRLYAWSDEVARCGELFVALFTNPGDGVSYIRPVPARLIDQIETADGVNHPSEDFELELRYHMLEPNRPLDGGRWWLSESHPEAWQPNEEGELPPIMLHFAVNRPVGALRGEGDLWPLLKWLRRYTAWLEDRVVLNHRRAQFVWDVSVPEHEIAVKQAQYRHPPSGASVLVHGPEEHWEARAPGLEAHDAAADGRAIRQMIAVGAAAPLHFLAETESATRATAREANLPSFRFYARRQQELVAFLKHLAYTVLRRAHAGRHLGRWMIQPQQIEARVTDLTREDNKSLAEAAHQIVQALVQMSDQGWIDRRTAVELAFKFAGELVDADDILARVDAAPGGSGGVRP